MTARQLLQFHQSTNAEETIEQRYVASYTIIISINIYQTFKKSRVAINIDLN